MRKSYIIDVSGNRFLKVERAVIVNGPTYCKCPTLPACVLVMGAAVTYVREDELSRAKTDNARQTNLFSAWVTEQARTVQFQALNRPTVNVLPQPQNPIQNAVQRFIQILPPPLQNVIANFQQVLTTPANALARFVWQPPRTSRNRLQQHRRHVLLVKNRPHPRKRTPRRRRLRRFRTV